MKTDQKIEALIETRINGNSISNNKTYSNMLSGLTKSQITNYVKNVYDQMVWGSKSEMIEQIVVRLTKRG